MSNVKVPGFLVKELVNAMVSAFPKQEDLGRMVRFELDENLQGIAGDNSLNDIVFKLVEYCESQGELYTLIQGALKANKVNTHLKEVEEKLILTIGLLEILQPLEEKYIEEMKGAYQACDFNKFNDWKEDRNTLNKLNKILKSIEDLSKGNYKENLLQFVTNLKKSDIYSKTAEELKQWRKKHDSNFDNGFTQNSSKSQINQEAISKIQPYLLIQLKSSQQYQKDRKNQYQVSSWLITDASNYHYKNNPDNCKFLENILDEEESEKSAFSIENDIPKLLKSFLIQRKDYYEPRKAQQPIIIFFLPYKLLNKEIEQIEPCIHSDDIKIPIGKQYCVLFRSVARLAKKYTSDEKWSEKWDKIKTNARNCLEEFKVIDDDYSSKDRLLYKLNQNKDTFAVQLNQTPCNDMIFQIIDFSGIPITILLRENQIESSTITEEFKKLLDCEIKHLPEKVKQLRLECCDEISKQKRIGHHLILLWEDPDLRPPQMEYTPA